MNWGDLDKWQQWALGIATNLVVVWLLWAWARFTVKYAKSKLLRLQTEKEAVDKLNDDLNAKLDAAAKDRDAYYGRLPDVALNKINENNNSNHERANDIAKDWVDREGATISQLLLYRAKWSNEHATGNDRPMGLLAAEAYANAAVALWPQNQEAANLRDYIADYQIETGQCSLPLTMALTQFDERADTLFNEDQVASANEAETEAQHRLDHGHYHLALPLVDLALRLRIDTGGEIAAQTLHTKRLKAIILLELGHADEALLLACSIAESSVLHLALGPSHPDTLISDDLVAEALHSLGRYDEALKKARSVENERAIHPGLGPSHPQTLVSGYRVAKMLDSLGLYSDALAKAESIEHEQATNPALGPSHPDTLMTSSLVAGMLRQLGRYDEALKKAQSVENKQVETLGSSHRLTLMSGRLVAMILYSLGRYEEVLAKAESVEHEQATNPALGPSHPDTTASSYMVANALYSLGRYDEALARAESIEKYFMAKLGPSHPDTLMNGHFIALILHSLGRNEEALQKATNIENEQKANPALGPSHPDTVSNSRLVAEILDSLK